MAPNSDIIAWTAGFYEGEGSCGMRGKLRWNETQQRYYRPQLRVEICQKDPTPLIFIKTSWKLKPKVYIDKYNKCHRYILSSKAAYEFLTTILPYMHSAVKIKQAETALQNYKQQLCKE